MSENKRKRKIFEPCQETKKSVEYEGNSLQFVYLERFLKAWKKDLRNWKSEEDYPNHNIIEIGENIEESPVVTQTPVIEHQLMLIWKKECEKKDKYLYLARELKKQWSMKVTTIPIVIWAFGTVTKGLLKGLEELEISGRGDTIQTTAFLRIARILRRVLEIWGDMLSFKLQWKTIC